jgi:predicted nucleic acid-binding protein
MTSEQASDWRFVLDANILLQAPIRDTILRLAEEEIIAVFWSPTILAEVERNFARVSGQEQARRRYLRLLAALQQSFPLSFTADSPELLPTLPITVHDRHVLACALDAPASVIITYNTRHFPANELAPYGVQAWHPAMLLIEVLQHFPDTLLSILIAQGTDMHPPRTLAQVLDRLAQDVPRFAAEARRRFGL